MLLGARKFLKLFVTKRVGTLWWKWKYYERKKRCFPGFDHWLVCDNDPVLCDSEYEQHSGVHQHAAQHRRRHCCRLQHSHGHVCKITTHKFIICAVQSYLLCKTVVFILLCVYVSFGLEERDSILSILCATVVCALTWAVLIHRIYQVNQKKKSPPYDFFWYYSNAWEFLYTI